jgi:hypothetical protein
MRDYTVMRLRLFILGAFVMALLVGCSHPMENKDLGNKNRDDTGKAMKQAGGGDE